MSKKATTKTSKKTTKKTTKKSTKKTAKKTVKASSNIIQAGDFIKLEFTGRVKETGAIFSTSDENIAKKSNIYDEKSKYGAVPLVAGQSFLLSGLDRQIVGLEVGKPTKLLVLAEEAYGPRTKEKIQTFSVKKLKAAGIKPKRGEKIQNKNQLGIIISVKEGRVRVDFNHGLAGKDLEFEVKVTEKIEDRSSQIFLMVSRYVSALKEEDFNYEANEDDKSISLDMSPFLLLTEGIQNISLRLISDLRQNFGYEKVEFKFKFDFSEIAKEEKKLEETLTAPVTDDDKSEDEDESEEK